MFEVRYLGYLLDRDGLRPDMERVKPILEYPVPKTKRQLRRFLGIVAWYSWFIEKESEIKLPLLKLIKKTQAWQWSTEQQAAFEKLKLALTRTPGLARPDFSLEFTVQYDASNDAIGAVLSQEFEDGEHPIIYIHRVLSSAERNYSTTEKECLALIRVIRKLRPYLEGYKFKAITDHSALKGLQTLKEPTGRLARWALELQQWNVRIEHRNIRRRDEIRDNPVKYRSWRVEDEMIYKQRRDPILGPVTGEEDTWKLVVPEQYRTQVLKNAHREVTAGHLGVEKTYDRIAQEYYWPGVWHDVYQFVQGCDECQRYKIDQTALKGLMGCRVVEGPWAVVASDLMEFPQSKGQYKYVVVFQDLFTRWVELCPLRTPTGKNVAKAFEGLVLFRWGTPDYLLTENEKVFDNKDLGGILEVYGMTRVPPPHIIHRQTQWSEVTGR